MSGQSNPKPATESLSILILAGGFGTRLRALDSERPKPMVLVNHKPFLHWQIQYYRDLGHRHFLISTGYKAEVIEEYGWNLNFPECRFEFFREKTPLGTGGAVQMVFQRASSLEECWVVNGDTLLPQPLPPVNREEADALYVVLERDQLFDAVPNLAVEGPFIVAEVLAGDYFDGGAVFVNRTAVERYEGAVPCSFHKLMEPSMSLRRVRYCRVSGTCYDIGTPDRFRRFVDFVSKNR